jgi:hypothetical protein
MGLPVEFLRFAEHLQSLDYEDCPRYGLLRQVSLLYWWNPCRPHHCHMLTIVIISCCWTCCIVWAAPRTRPLIGTSHRLRSGRARCPA